MNVQQLDAICKRRLCFHVLLIGLALSILITMFLTFEITRTCTGDCSFQHRLAIIVPFRDRFEELLDFLPHMTRFLNKQNIKHTFYIINQADTFRFNRGALINVGFHLSRGHCDYLVMHDVDLLPLNPGLDYRYPEPDNVVVHLAAPHLHPQYHYKTFLGGIVLMTHRTFESVNGLSNKYWGWGLEDDEFYTRLKAKNIQVIRPGDIGTGTSDTFRHIHYQYRKRVRDTERFYNQKNESRKRDRVTGLADVAYDVISHRVLSLDDGKSGRAQIFLVALKCDLEKTPWCKRPSKSSSSKKLVNANSNR